MIRESIQRFDVSCLAALDDDARNEVLPVMRDAAVEMERDEGSFGSLCRLKTEHRLARIVLESDLLPGEATERVARLVRRFLDGPSGSPSSDSLAARGALTGSRERRSERGDDRADGTG